MMRFEFAALDFETTGAVEGYPVEPWQVGVARVGEGGVVLWESLLRVGPRPFHPRAPGRHAALREEISAAPRLADCLPDLRRLCLGVVLVGHNVATEQKCLRDQVPMEAFGPWVDTLKLSRAIWPGLPSHALGDVLASLGLSGEVEALCPDRAPHDALYDAVGSAVLLRHVLALPGWDSCDLRVLQRPDLGPWKQRKKQG